MNRINQYTCDTCGGTITTIERVAGVTPLYLACRATDGCKGRMLSAMYRVDHTDPRLVPQWEWYKPSDTVNDPDTAEHVRQGGLLLRRFGGNEPHSAVRESVIGSAAAIAALSSFGLVPSFPPATPKRELTDADRRHIAAAEAKRQRKRERNARLWAETPAP